MNINNVISYKGQTQTPVTQKTKNTKTSIFYVNDIHGKIPKMQRLFSAAQHTELLAKQNGADILKFSSGDTFIGEDVNRYTIASTFLNMANIDAETLGNHEFDFGMSQMRHLTDLLDAPVVSANFRDLHSGELVFPAYRMLR